MSCAWKTVHFTFVAEIFGLSNPYEYDDAPPLERITQKIGIETDVPAIPFSGVIALSGFKASVVVVTGDVVAKTVPELVTAAVTADVVTTGFFRGTRDGSTCVTLTVLTFSSTDLSRVSVRESIRYPQLPSSFL